MTTTHRRCTHCNQPADDFLLILTRQLWCCETCRPLLIGLGTATWLSTVTFTNEGGGTTAACECGWLRFATSRPAANKVAAKHAPKCKGAPVTQEPAPVARRGASNWSKREDSTWIDKL